MRSAICCGVGALGECLKWLPHCRKASTSSRIRAADGFQRRGGLGTTGAVWESNHHPHYPQMPDVTPLLALPGFQHKPDHLRSSSRIVHHCIATDPALPRLHWDIWSYSGCHLFLEGGAVEGGVVPQNWAPWYAHLSAALVAARHVMWHTKLCTLYYLIFPIKDKQAECTRARVVMRFFSLLHSVCPRQRLVWEHEEVGSSLFFLTGIPQMWKLSAQPKPKLK